jgi:hypothetical protein
MNQNKIFPLYKLIILGILLPVSKMLNYKGQCLGLLVKLHGIKLHRKNY